jgi:hypothetical protein
VVSASCAFFSEAFLIPVSDSRLRISSTMRFRYWRMNCCLKKNQLTNCDWDHDKIDAFGMVGPRTILRPLPARTYAHNVLPGRRGSSASYIHAWMLLCDAFHSSQSTLNLQALHWHSRRVGWKVVSAGPKLEDIQKVLWLGGHVAKVVIWDLVAEIG